MLPSLPLDRARTRGTSLQGEPDSARSDQRIGKIEGRKIQASEAKEYSVDIPCAAGNIREVGSRRPAPPASSLQSKVASVESDSQIAAKVTSIRKRAMLRCPSRFEERLHREHMNPGC